MRSRSEKQKSSALQRWADFSQEVVQLCDEESPAAVRKRFLVGQADAHLACGADVAATAIPTGEVLGSCWVAEPRVGIVRLSWRTYTSQPCSARTPRYRQGSRLGPPCLLVIYLVRAARSWLGLCAVDERADPESRKASPSSCHRKCRPCRGMWTSSHAVSSLLLHAKTTHQVRRAAGIEGLTERSVSQVPF